VHCVVSVVLVVCRDLSSVKQCVKAVRDLGLPGVHVLINNAGGTTYHTSITSP
jgi:NAD(P)-dependent dehydrogenase (short-subunit alcohol dehydrogenase family)